MPAAGVEAFERRTAHERGEKAHPAAELAGRRAEQQRMIGRFERRPRGERALDLPRTEFVLDRSQRQTDLLEARRQRGEHRLHQIHVGFGVIGKSGFHRPGPDRAPAHAGQAGMLRGQMIIRDPQQIPFDFETNERAHALLRQPLELLAQQLPGGEVKRHAVVEVFVAQHPADTGRPGQHAKSRGVGDDGEIGRAGHLLESHAPAAGERVEDPGVGRIERAGRDVDVVAAGERGREARRRHRLGARRTVRIGPREAHEMQIVGLDPALDVFGLPSLLVRPEAVFCNESERLCHLHRSMRDRGRKCRGRRGGDPHCRAGIPNSEISWSGRSRTRAPPRRGCRAARSRQPEWCEHTPLFRNWKKY